MESSSSEGKGDEKMRTQGKSSSGGKNLNQVGHSSNPNMLESMRLSQWHRLNVFMLIRILFQYLEKVDTVLLGKAQKVLKLCDGRKKSGDPEYQSLATKIPQQIREAVGDIHWNRAVNIHQKFLKNMQLQKKKKRQIQVNMLASNMKTKCPMEDELKNSLTVMKRNEIKITAIEDSMKLPAALPTAAATAVVTPYEESIHLSSGISNESTDASSSNVSYEQGHFPVFNKMLQPPQNQCNPQLQNGKNYRQTCSPVFDHMLQFARGQDTPQLQSEFIPSAASAPTTSKLMRCSTLLDRPLYFSQLSNPTFFQSKNQYHQKTSVELESIDSCKSKPTMETKHKFDPQQQRRQRQIHQEPHRQPSLLSTDVYPWSPS